MVTGVQTCALRSALRLANAIIYGWGGVPVIWSGDELGQFNDPNWDTEPGHEWSHSRGER